MDKYIPPAPTITPDDSDGYVCHWDGSDVSILATGLHYDRFKGLKARLRAFHGNRLIHDTEIALFSQYEVSDYHRVCQDRDGVVNWTAHIIPMVGPLKDAFDQHVQNLEQSQPRTPWHVFSLADAFTPQSPPVHLAEGLITLPSLSIVYGAPGTLKSFLLLDMLICIAAGKKVRGWLCPLDANGGFPRMVKQAPALWVDFDNGPRRMHTRAAAVARAYDLRENIPFHYVSMPTPWLDASKAVGLDPLREAIERYQTKVVVIDNLLLVKGDLEENSADMGLVMAHLRQLTEEYGCAVIPVHHQRKDQGGNGRSGDRLRGHSSIEAAIDLALLVEREDGSSAITISSTKTRDIDVSPFAAMFTYEHQPGTTELFSARFYGVPQDDERSDKAIDFAIRDILTGGRQLLKKDLCDEVHTRLPKVGINRIRGIIDLMVAKHHISSRSGAKGGQWLSKN
jgi:hypothetical protein